MRAYNPNLEKIRVQVQHNCELSDARYMGNFSLCTFLLLVRNFYKWHCGLEPWEEGESDQTLAWIEKQEEEWEKMNAVDFVPISCGDNSCDPFELEEINRFLQRENLLYGAGYAYGLKPTFFLAQVERTEEIDTLKLIFLGKEIARDVPAPPAMRQGENIYIRRNSARYYLYDRIFERFTSKKKSVVWALVKWNVQCYGDLPKKLDDIVDQEIMSMAYHEVGEALENVFGDAWGEILSRFALTSVERFARSVKDVLADTHPNGLLGHLITEKKTSSLGFYISFLDGFSKLLCPEIQSAFDRFMVSEDWTIVEEARQAGYDKNRAIAVQLLELCRQTASLADDNARKEIEAALMNPLYCSNGS